MRRVRQVLATLLAGLAALSVAATAPTGPAAAAEAEEPNSVRVLLSSVQPVAPKPGDQLVIRGRVVNNTAKERDVTVGLRLNRTALYNRTEVELVNAGVPGIRNGARLPSPQLPLGKLAPGVGQDFTLTVPVDDLRLPANGVYVIGVEARSASRRLAVQETFLPWLPKNNLYAPTSLAWLWPVAAPPARDAHGAFLDEADQARLTQRLSPTGSLSALVRDAGQAPVTWAVDPDLLDSAAALGDEDQPGTAWLDQLRAATTGRPVAALPYADPDLVSLVGRKMDELAIDAVRRGWVSAGQHLGRPVDATLVWPADGVADSRTLGLVRQAGGTRAILDGRALALTASLTYTPTGRARVRTPVGPIDVLVADTGLTNALSVSTRFPGEATLATQRFLAETAMITLERPNQPRTVLVAPPHRWEPAPGWAAGLLAALPQTPWVRMVPLADLTEIEPQPEYDGARAVPTRLEGSPPISRKTLDGIAAVATDQRLLSGLLAPDAPLMAGYVRAQSRAASSAWERDPKAGRAYLKHLKQEIEEDRAAVRIISRGLVTLSSNEGTIPVTVANDLTEPISVFLRVTPRVASRLQVGAPEQLRIAAGRKATVSVPAVASANGISVVDLQLVTPGGRDYGPQLQMRVNATNFGALGLIIVGTAAGLLILAAIWTNVRRIRRARRARLGPFVHGPAADVAARTEPQPDEKIGT